MFLHISAKSDKILISKQKQPLRILLPGGEMMASQTKSKQRVTDHGEVFTAEREVKAMCDLVKQEAERIESRFLEIILLNLIQRVGIIKKCVFAV